MRIIVANSPRMYRESLALSIQRRNPDFEVLIVSPEDLDGHVARFRPHAFVRDDDGVTTEAPDGVVLWVGIVIDDHLNARIAMDGEVSELRDIGLDELQAALEDAGRRLSSGGA